MAEFCSIAEEKFAFLESDFAFSLESEREEEWGGEVIYSGADLAIRILYEYSSAFVFVFICKLVGGEIRRNPRPVMPDSIITCFDFNDMLPAEEKMKPAYEYNPDSLYFDENEGLANYVAEFSVRLRRYGAELLRGDFSVFPKMEAIIKARAVEYS